MKEKTELKAEYMIEALREAELAFSEGEVPVGAVVVRGGEIISRAHNLCEREGDPTMHAELIALRAAARRLSKSRLTDCELYVTLEPCPMCMGAILNFRIGALCFGAFDPASGCCVSKCELGKCTIAPEVPFVGGMLEEESLRLLDRFFSERRHESSKTV